jgi:hypothetical protein
MCAFGSSQIEGTGKSSLLFSTIHSRAAQPRLNNVSRRKSSSPISG